MTFHDTIAAIATAPGRGGVAVIRVSGPEAFQVAERLTGKTPAPGRIQFATFHNVNSGATPWGGGALAPATGVQACATDAGAGYPPSVASREASSMRGAPPPQGVAPLDTGLLLSFKAPHSYTGEDVVEFQCHGGTVTPRRILDAALAAGARLARRGEFTERAFLNGKLALDQAESVLDLIDAKTDRAADAALGDLLAVDVAPSCDGTASLGAGASSPPQPSAKLALRALYDRTLAVASTLEHALDIDEGELPGDFFTRVAADIAALRADFIAARARARERALLREGALVVLAGPPNAGKSSLLNALVGANRAIVSDVPGTTRDAVEVWLDLEGWPVRLVDTAGLRDTGDAIEAEGVRRARDLMAQANVVIELGKDIHAKCDLGHVPGKLNVSAKTGEGLIELKRAIAARLAEQAATFAEETGDTHEATLVECLALLDAPTFNLQPSTFNLQPSTYASQPPLDLVLAGNQLRRIGEKLGEELGVTYTEDLLDRVFSRFCVGK